MSKSLLEVKLKQPTSLDPDFCPIVLGNRNYRESLIGEQEKCRVTVALERKDGRVSRMQLDVHAPGGNRDADTRRYLERQIKSLIWVKGGSRLFLSGPKVFCEYLQLTFSPSGARAYDANRMQVVYDQPLEILAVEEIQLPEENEIQLSLGGHLDGNRIGFDLGASDYKLSAVIEGKAVFSTEIPWNPCVQTDPQYHYTRLSEGLKLAAEHLPKVDAIGGSAAGAYVNNLVKYASLFRNVPEKEFRDHIRPLFLNLQREWDVPLDVLNDGEVTALAGALSLKKTALLGIAMGSSEASGFVNRQGFFSGDYNELSYVPVDYNPNAAREPVSGDVGCGALYFSQQAVNRLAPKAGFSFPENMLLPERLKIIQQKANAGDKAALDVFATIGIYLGYTLPYYAELFDFEHVLILGRVTSGVGGERIINKTREVLHKEFPEFAENISLHVPDEKNRRVGQAVAAASLPVLS